MGHTTPIFVPLAKGLDLSKEATLGADELHDATNVDFSVDGRVQGRPSRSAPKLFAVRDPASTTYGMLSTQTFSATGFTARGLCRLRDAAGERAALACDGRLFTQEGSRWTDRGPFASMKVDRIVNYEPNLTGSRREAVAQDFGPTRVVSGTQLYGLLTSSGAIDREYASNFPSQLQGTSVGNSARCGTTTAIAAYDDLNNNVVFVYRTNGADTVTAVTIATDAIATMNDNGDSPAICCSFDQTAFFVAYLTDTANVFKVLKVGLTGTVAATYTSGAIAGLTGIWVDNTSVAGNKVVVAYTHSGGMTVRQLNATTMADLSLDGTHDGSDGLGTVGLDVVVGVQSTSLAWWAFRNSNAVGSGDLVVGTTNLSTGTATRARKFWGGDTYTEASIRWGIAHQPILCNNRMYLTLVASSNRATTGTWLTLDLTNWYGSVSGTGPFNNPTLVARGPTEATIPYLQPASATLLSDGTGWTFATLDWSRFETTQSGGVSVLTGVDASLGMNRVSFTGPRCAQLGESTVFSGSIPHVVSRGQSAELGFPFLAGIPGLSVEATGGGAVGTGSYGVVACWRWTDEAGQIHRSAPSIIRTVSVPGGGTSTITSVVTNPWLSSKNYGDLKIELYITDINPTAGASHFLQQTVTPVLTGAYTTITVNTQPVTTTESIYTDGGVFGNYHVPGDGGVAALGRRLWLASGNVLYASKLHRTGYGPEFSDEASDGVASLFMTLPSGAGRILALEALDDKLLVFCQRGVYFLQDGGPDNTGAGNDFGSPMRLSDLVVGGPRSTVLTDAGVVFCTTTNATDPSKGGPWLLDRQLTLTERQYLGRPALTYFAASITEPEVAYVPERQQVFVEANGVIMMVDMRVGKWAVWDIDDAGTFQCMAGVGGALWTLYDEPAPFDGTPGTDDLGNYSMIVATSHLAANGRDGLGWGRVQGVSVLPAEGSGAHTLNMTVTQDGHRVTNSGNLTVAAGSSSTSWPSNRPEQEWRLPTPKCSTIQVQMSALPATARWAAIRLDVRPLSPRAPSKHRS